MTAPPPSAPSLDGRLDTWLDQLSERVEHSDAHQVLTTWRDQPLAAYAVVTGPQTAAADADLIARGRPSVTVVADGTRWRLRCTLPDTDTGIGEALAILDEGFGLQLVDIVSHRLPSPDGTVTLLAVSVQPPAGAPSSPSAGVADAIAARLARPAPTDVADGLDRLVLTADLDPDQVAVLRAYRAYERQLTLPRTAPDPLIDHPQVAARLTERFDRRLDPDANDLPEPDRDELADVADADAARSLEVLAQLIDATVRTNVWQAPSHGHLAFKFDGTALPRSVGAAWREVFVHGHRVEGVHLRAGKLARGGIRHSDRPADYRHEILALMRTQTLKNAAIVPTGAKGGFVIRDPATTDPGEAYDTFIAALFDLVDDVDGDGVVTPPPGVRRRDDDDPYLVVAADKGTATFSDRANRIAHQRGFWLADAFAAGGAHGFDHKALGITARGAWESATEHLTALGIDPDRDAFTAVGIGDMSGDVFGNALLRTDQVRLIAAFDHRHILLDPDPDPTASFRARRTLFDTPGSSWDDIDRDALGPDAAVHPRTARSISLPERVRTALGIDRDEVSGPELVAAVLAAPVDLLYAGGIGTYVRADDEDDGDAADRLNDPVRITASQLRARTVVEGANLALTPRARVLYARGGGRINADFVDNVAGVATSDQEVTLRLIGHLADDAPELTDLTDAVVDTVLDRQRRQLTALTAEVARSQTDPSAYHQLLASRLDDGVVRAALGRRGTTDPALDATSRGLTRPEVAVLQATVRRELADAIIGRPTLPARWSHRGCAYLPETVHQRFCQLVDDRRMRPEVARAMIARVVVDQLVTAMGTPCVDTLTNHLGVEAADVVHAWTIAADVDAALGSPDVADDDRRRCLERATRSYLATVRTDVDVVADADLALASELDGSGDTLDAARIADLGAIAAMTSAPTAQLVTHFEHARQLRSADRIERQLRRALPTDAVQAQLVANLADQHAAVVRRTTVSSLHGIGLGALPTAPIADRLLCDLECRTTPPVDALAVAVLTLAT